MATSLGPHRNGPQIKYIIPEYKEGKDANPLKDHPEWNAAHVALLKAGIPTIENVGGDIDDVTGKRVTFQGFPWKWLEGDACVIRLVALLDPNGNVRLEPGKKGKQANTPATQPIAAVKKSRGEEVHRQIAVGHQQHQGPGVLQPQPSLGARHAGMAVAPRCSTSRCCSCTAATACSCSSSTASCIAAPTWMRRCT